MNKPSDAPSRRIKAKRKWYVLHSRLTRLSNRTSGAISPYLPRHRPAIFHWAAPSYFPRTARSRKSPVTMRESFLRFEFEFHASLRPSRSHGRCRKWLMIAVFGRQFSHSAQFKRRGLRESQTGIRFATWVRLSNLENVETRVKKLIILNNQRQARFASQFVRNSVNWTDKVYNNR